MIRTSSPTVRFTAVFLFTFVLAIGGSRAYEGEWILQRHVPYDIDVFHDISFLQGGQTGWAVGQVQYGRLHSGSAILRTTDGGITWKEQEIGMSNVNNAIFFVDEGNGWVVGGRGAIAHTCDGGSTWVSQTSGTQARLKSVSFLSETDGWVVGDSVILRTADGGATWEGSEDRYPTRFNAVTFSTMTEGWAVGSNGAIFHTVDKGTSWTSMPSPTEKDLSHLFFADEQIGWIVGKSGVILFTDNRGESWTVQSSGTIQSLNSLSFVDENRGWAVGSNGTVLHTTNRGELWQSLNDLPASAVLYAVQSIDQDRAWACGEGGIFLQVSAGRDSSSYVMGGPNATLRDVAFVDSKHGWACGENGTILRTIDGGQEWTAQRCGLDALLMGIDFVDLTHGWLVTFEGNMLKTEDGGVRWSFVQPPPGMFRGIDYVDRDDVWAVGEHMGRGAIFHNQQVAFQGSIGGPLEDIHFADRSNGWAVGAGGTILHTSNGGATWDVQPSNVTEMLTHVWATDLATAWVAGHVDGILKTTDGGDEWRRIDLASSHSYGPIAFPSPYVGWVVGRSNADGSVRILRTTNGGNTWQSTPVGSEEGFLATACASPYEGWTVGEKGTIWYYTDLPFHTISGQTIYCDNGDSIRGVTLSLSGFAVDTVITDENGRFQFASLRQGRTFCIEPHMTGAPRQVITSFDASLILRSVLGVDTLSACDSVAADVTGNNRITAFDASTILRYVVGEETEGLTGTWTFLPEMRCYENLRSNQQDQIFRGIIHGDVSQNWPGIPGTGVPVVSIILPHTGAAAGSDFWLLLYASPDTNTSLESLEVFSYEAQIDYDPLLLRIIGLSDTGLVTEGWGTSVSRIDNDSGQLFITKAGHFPLPWSGRSPTALLRIQFHVNRKAPFGATDTLMIASMIFNEGMPQVTTRHGFFQVLRHTVSGQVTYCSSGVEVPGVLLSLSGDSTLTVSTDKTGWYGFNGLKRGGNYCVSTLSKEDVPADVVTSLDASLVLRGEAGLTRCGRLAADVNGDGAINSDDALFISRFAVGKGGQGRVGQWSFLPPGTCYDDLPSDQTEQNYEAFIYGDVSGNYPTTVEGPESPLMFVDVPDESAYPGATVGLHVVIDSFSCDCFDSLHIYACDLQLNYDPSVLSAFLVSTEGLITESWGTIASTIDETTGSVRLGMTSATPLSHDVSAHIPIIRVEFHLSEEASPGEETSVRISRALFNEGSPKTYRTEGLLHILGKSISGVVRYCETRRRVGGVVLQVFSSTTERDTSDVDGEYLFDNLRPGRRYCVFPIQGAPLGSEQRVITSYDAARIFRHVVLLDPFSACDSIAADVSGDGTVSPYDGSLILRYVVSSSSGAIPSPPGRTGMWHFEPVHRCFESLLYDETSDYDAVLYGDVSQNWPGLPPAKVVHGAILEIGQPKVTPGSDNEFTVPIHVRDHRGIIAADITLTYDESRLTPVRASTTSLTSEWKLAYQVHENGILKIATAGCREPMGPGPIVDIEFQTGSNSDLGSTFPVEITVSFNEGLIPSPQTIRQSLKPRPLAPTDYELSQNYPNPFNPTTHIHYTLPVTGERGLVTGPIHTTLRIYNVLGQQVKTLVAEFQEAGSYTATWDGKDESGADVASGVYFYQMKAGDFVRTQRMLLLK